MQLDSVFSFGRHKGLTLQEVYQGSLNPNREVLALYLNHVLRIVNDGSYNHINPLFEFLDKLKFSYNTIEVIGTLEFWESDLDKFGEPIGELCDVELGNIQNDLKYIINQHFSENWLGILENIASFKGKLPVKAVIGGDPHYIAWCIRTIDSFKLEEEVVAALQNLPVAAFKGVEVMYLKRNFYEYAPLINLETFQFSEKILELNKIK